MTGIQRSSNGQCRLCTFFLISALISPAFADLQFDTVSKHELISGVYKEQLPLPIFYDTYIPIIFEYQLPEWNKSEITFNNWYTCLTETTPYKYTCPTVFHMNKAILNLHIDFESLQPVLDTGSNSEYFDTLYKTSSFCDTIQQHFSGVFIQELELNEYIEMLEKCHFDDPLTYVERSIPDFNYTLRAPFSKMENNYYNTYYKPMTANSTTGTNLELVASATLSNARTTIQATLLNVFYAEKYRWVHALQDCQQQRLPHSLVTLQKLNDTLVQLSRKANFGSKYEFSIPLNLMSKYYSLPLTDCTYTSSTFVVRLLFPIKLKSTDTNSMIMYKFRPIPFHYENKLCAVEMYNEVEERHIHDSSANLTYSTTCTSGSLCQVSELFQSNLIDHCASGIISNNFTATKDNCEFECKDASWMNLEAKPLVTRVRSDMLVLTSGNNQTTVEVKCFGQIEATEIKLVDTGALEIILPCKCKLLMNSRTYFAEYPCNDSTSPTVLTITQIEPWHLHISDKIDANDSTTDSVALEYFMLRKAIYMQHLHDAATSGTDLSDDEIHEHQNHLDGVGNAEASQLTGRGTHGSAAAQSNSSTASSNTLLWTFFIISTIILFTLQIYIIYQLRIIRIHSSGGPTLMQTMAYSVRGGGRTQEAQNDQFLLLNDQAQ